MNTFSTFISLLEDELVEQNKLLNLLVGERAAIVRMNKEQIVALGKEKEKIITRAKSLEKKRK